ncbi:hypothetical protein FQR65_LT10406 [Abscondita terminalis]|nr:hypothetical protein FQR65_LT10406 [Abscondita terminalis]
MFSSYDSSDDETHGIPIRRKVYQERINFQTDNGFEFNETFRLTRLQTQYVMELIGHELLRVKNRNNVLNVQVRSVERSIKFLMLSLIILFQNTVSCPENPENIPVEFLYKRGFTCVCACLDGTLLNIDKPNVHEEFYVDRYGDHSWNLPSQIAKKRWKNLRGNYTKHLKTYVPSGSGASVKRPYFLSEYISFVLPFTKSRQSKGNVEAPKNETEELKSEQLVSPNEVENYKNNQGRKHDSDDEQSITEEVNQDVSDAVSSQQDNLKKRNDSFNLKQGKEKKVYPVLTLEVNKSALEYFEKYKQAAHRPPTLTNDDADIQFLLSLLPDLKKMNDKQKRQYKVGVLNLDDQIFEEPVISHTTSPQTLECFRSYSSLSAHSMHSSRQSTFRFQQDITTK